MGIARCGARRSPRWLWPDEAGGGGGAPPSGSLAGAGFLFVLLGLRVLFQDEEEKTGKRAPGIVLIKTFIRPRSEAHALDSSPCTIDRSTRHRRGNRPSPMHRECPMREKRKKARA